MRLWGTEGPAEPGLPDSKEWETCGSPCLCICPVLWGGMAEWPREWGVTHWGLRQSLDPLLPASLPSCPRVYPLCFLPKY